MKKFVSAAVIVACILVLLGQVYAADVQGDDQKIEFLQHENQIDVTVISQVAAEEKISSLQLSLQVKEEPAVDAGITFIFNPRLQARIADSRYQKDPDTGIGILNIYVAGGEALFDTANPSCFLGCAVISNKDASVTVSVVEGSLKYVIGTELVVQEKNVVYPEPAKYNTSSGGGTSNGEDSAGGSAGGSSTGGSTGGGSAGGGSADGGGSSTDGAKTDTKTEIRPDGTNVVTTTITQPNGTWTEIVTETKPDGAVTVTTTTKQADGSAKTVVEKTEMNKSGNEVSVTVTTEKDAGGRVISATKTAVIADAAKDTSVTVTVAEDASQTKTATARIVRIGKMDSSGSVNGTISSAVVRQIKEAAETSDVRVVQTVTNADGTPRYKVEVNTGDLKEGEALTLMKLDPKTDEYVLCNAKKYYVSDAGGVSLSLKSKGNFVFLNKADAKAKSDAVLKTVRVKNAKKTLKAGKSVNVVMSSGLNMKNVSKITYTVSNKSVASVSKSGKVTAKKAGTVIVKAKVTLKNKKNKTVRMTVRVQ